MGKQSVIKVLGAAILNVAPDYNNIRIDVKHNFQTNDEAYEAAKQNNLSIIAALKSVGLDESQAKTTQFNICEHIDIVYKNDDDDFGSVSVRRKNGYDLKQSINIDLPAGDKRINEICVAITASVPNAEIKLDTFLSNRREYEMKALTLAVQDAREKANIMAAALGCTLGDILEVDHGCEELGYRYAYNKPFGPSHKLSGTALEMVGEDVTIRELAMVTWKIVNP